MVRRTYEILYTKQEDAYDKAENIRRYIENYNFETIGRKTVSLGIGAYSEDLTLDEFITSVDQALYRAKANGRNRVEEI